jgi:hypothetical protein
VKCAPLKKSEMRCIFMLMWLVVLAVVCVAGVSEGRSDMEARQAQPAARALPQWKAYGDDQVRQARAGIWHPRGPKAHQDDEAVSLGRWLPY